MVRTLIHTISFTIFLSPIEQVNTCVTQKGCDSCHSFFAFFKRIVSFIENSVQNSQKNRILNHKNRDKDHIRMIKCLL